MIEVSDRPIVPGLVIDKVRAGSSGSVVIYIGMIHEYSRGKPVLSLEFQDLAGTAADKLRDVSSAVHQKWQLDDIAICHRIGKLKVGDINLVIAVVAAHRSEAFAACQYALDRLRQAMPTSKKETYQDGSVWVEGE